jgi:hypothetical protein
MLPDIGRSSAALSVGSQTRPPPTAPNNVACRKVGYCRYRQRGRITRVTARRTSGFRKEPAVWQFAKVVTTKVVTNDTNNTERIRCNGVSQHLPSPDMLQWPPPLRLPPDPHQSCGYSLEVEFKRPLWKSAESRSIRSLGNDVVSEFGLCIQFIGKLI